MISEFVAGSLPSAQAIAVSAHLSYCTQCQQHVKKLEVLGGQLLEALPAAALDEALFAKLEQRIQSMQTDKRCETAMAATAETVAVEVDAKGLPSIIRQLLSKQASLQWKCIGASLKRAPLHTGQNRYEVSLNRIAAGGKVVQHDHRGEEITLVIKGSFSDEDGLYQAGDFILKQPGDIHRPLAAKHEQCVCLVVQEAPILLTGVLAKWFNPFLKVYPG
ncbi:MAG: ChrR family anti-sigma-E factor [Cellvibrionaceae bacterium]|nr:ChrR family anti-sigma-E factor [Cellvibrionaceae bacterium]